MKTQRKKEWFDDQLFWRDLYPFIFSEKRFADTEYEVENLLKLTKPKGKAILDLCSGPGRFSIALAQRGFAVTGVDKTKYLLERARAKARTAKTNIEWIQNDMRDFVRSECPAAHCCGGEDYTVD
jgi:2-polyprenyl-3-methyl-5-hydroxy-6-metoxy-1,4-benzoquinol methylase